MKKILLAVMLMCILCSCSANHESTAQLFCMDTVMDIKAYGAKSDEAVKEAEQEIKRLDALLDRQDRNSEIYSINNGSTETVSTDTENILKKALEVSAETNGAFDITISPVMDLWGFYGQQYTVPDTADLKNALKSVGYKNVFFNNGSLRLMNNAQIDLGGIAKGCASDMVIEIFRNYGIKSALINLGGNVYALGRRTDGKPWRVAVTDPYNKSGYAATLETEDKAVITSGGYQRYFEEDGKTYHHIIDPGTGYPADNGVKSVTVISSDAARADALSTALFVMGKDKAEEFLKKHDDIDAVIITNDKTVYYTARLSDSIEIENGFNSARLADGGQF